MPVHSGSEFGLWPALFAVICFLLALVVGIARSRPFGDISWVGKIAVACLALVGNVGFREGCELSANAVYEKRKVR